MRSPVPSAVREREAALDAAAAAAHALAEPCPKCGGRFADTWTGGKDWQCYTCRRDQPIVNKARCEAERVAMDAVVALDAARAPTTDERERQHLERGVQVGWLKNEFLASLTPEQQSNMTTAEAVAELIKPQCVVGRCRFVELPKMRRFVGRARKFISEPPGRTSVGPSPTGRARRLLRGGGVASGLGWLCRPAVG